MRRDDGVEQFRKYLRENSLPITAQRLAIADIVLGSDDHMSAEAVLIELGSRGAYAGTATVYRTLELLLRSGMVVERDFGEGFKRYHNAQGVRPHGYLQCTRCGRIIEFADERLEQITPDIAQAHSFRVETQSLVITGLCAECATLSAESDPAGG